VAAFSSCILVSGLNIYISYCFKYIGTIKPAGGYSGGQYRLYIEIYSVLKKRMAVSEAGGLTGIYCI